MKRVGSVLGALTLALLASSYLALAQGGGGGQRGGGREGGGREGGGQGARAGGQQPAPQPMSFFVTSVGKGDGANLGGIAGADAHCQMLAAAAGRGAATWHAYMSTQGGGAVNARDRIGSGPWYNARGVMVARDNGTLHGDTLDQARLGNALGKQFS